MADFTVQVVAGWQRNIVPGIIERLGRIGDEMVEEAQSIVPVATGELQDSIDSFIEQRDQSTGRFNFPSLWFGATAPYTAYVEFGHHTVAGDWVEAQPFIRPVALKHRDF